MDAYRYENIFRLGYCPDLLELSDGRLSTDDGFSFDIHRATLARSSSFFCELYCGAEKGGNDVSIPGVKGEVLSYILTYIYTSNLCITQSNLCDLLVAADYLLVDGLVTVIENQLSCHLSVSNCLSVFANAMLMNHSDILRQTFRYIQMHFEEIVENDHSKLTELPLDALKRCLCDKNLRVQNENIIWLAIAKWVQEDIFNRQSQVPDLLIHLIIRDVDETLASRILEHSIIAENPFCDELVQMKQSNSFNNNFAVLFRYFITHSQPTLPLYKLRQPRHLNIIARHCLNEGLKHELFVSYDENIDFWRKITEFNFRPDFLMSFASDIFADDSLEEELVSYNLIHKEWTMWPGFEDIVGSGEYQIVKLEGLICVLGSFSGAETPEVLAYDPERNEWSEVAPMFPVTDDFAAVTLRRSIFVIGNSPSHDFEVVAQKYDQETAMWVLLPAPAVRRRISTVVVYQDRILVLGGYDEVEQHLKAVEVFDPFRNEWTRKKDLPYAFMSPKAVILFDSLIVFDNCEEPTLSPVRWNDGLGCWITVEESSPLNKLQHYLFCTLDDSECINMMTRESRDPSTNFLKSPFN